MKVKPISGFDALKFKDEAQARVQAELAGLPAEERIHRIHQDVEKGPLGDWWRRQLAERRARMKADFEREQEERAA